MSNEVWRDDTRSTEIASIDFHVNHAEDQVQVSETFPSLAIIICHVRSFHGEGFMFSLRSLNSVLCNGEIFLGTNSAAYQKALREGRAAMQKQEQEWEATKRNG